MIMFPSSRVAVAILFAFAIGCAVFADVTQPVARTAPTVASVRAAAPSTGHTTYRQSATAQTSANRTAVATQSASRSSTSQAAAWRSPQHRPLQTTDDIFDYKLENPDDVGWLARRLEIGWRIARIKADKKHCWHEAKTKEEEYGFLGSMEYLDETDSYDYCNLVASYKIFDWFAIGATWDRISEVATTRSDDKHQDGEWREKGPSISAILTTPRLFGIASPYFELGFHFPNASFDPYSWWTLGYPSPAYYESIGSPSRSNNGYERIITAQEADAMTLLWGVGLKVYVTENIALDLAYRHIECDIDAQYRLYSNGRMFFDHGSYTIPLNYSQLCVGVRWAF